MNIFKRIRATKQASKLTVTSERELSRKVRRDPQVTLLTVQGCTKTGNNDDDEVS